jgi:hypothetical protein
MPRGGIDPIRSEDDALAVIGFLGPLGHDTVALMLDTERRGSDIVVVTGTVDPDAVFTVIDLCAARRTVDHDALILATGRPGGGLRDDDAARWVEVDLECELAGLRLVEWFVLGWAVGLPRERAGDPPRWTS